MNADQLPITAHAFTITSGTGKSVRFSDFPSLLKKKLTQTDGENASIMQSAFRLYEEVTKFDAIIYAYALVELNNLSPSPNEVYYGRDAYWLYLARKAQQFITPHHNRRRISYAFANEDLLDDPQFDLYMNQEKITEESRHIDVGCNGRTVKTIINKLAVRKGITPDTNYITDHIALLAAHQTKDNPLTNEAANEMGTEVRQILESRSRHLTRPTQIVRRNGRLHTNASFTSTQDMIFAWTVGQAITRRMLYPYVQPCT